VTDRPVSSIAALLVAAATDLAGVERRSLGPGSEWSTRGIIFAAVHGDRAEFRLAQPIAAAARRTPGTDASARGADWVAFAPPELDGYAIDRAEAWLASAWRHASADA
jgi:hypothetical protein